MNVSVTRTDFTDRPALAAMRKSLEDSLRLRTVAQVLSRKALSPVYQPIVRLGDAASRRTRR